MGVCLEKTSTSKKISIRRKIKPKRHTEIHVATEQSKRCIARYYKYVPGADTDTTVERKSFTGDTQRKVWEMTSV